MRLLHNDTCAVLIDVQERLLPHIHDHQTLVKRITVLIEGLNVLGLPWLLTEQYPKGLGATIPEIRERSEGKEPIQKMSFSCCDESLFTAPLAQLNRPVILVAGIEAHVCVLQTVLDLLAQDYEPVVVADAVSSRKPYDREIALQRMQDAGARLTTTESVLFELCRYAGTDRFRAISRLVK